MIHMIPIGLLEKDEPYERLPSASVCSNSPENWSRNKLHEDCWGVLLFKVL